MKKIRRKILLGGYEVWVEREGIHLITLFDAKKSRLGLPIDFDGHRVMGRYLTPAENLELSEYLKSTSTKPALRYTLLRLAQSCDLVDPTMKESEEEFKDQAKGLFTEFCNSFERSFNDTFIGMQQLIKRKRSYIPQG